MNRKILGSLFLIAVPAFLGFLWYVADAQFQAEKAQKERSETSVQESWTQAQEKNTVEAYERFIEANPSHELSLTAQAAIEKLIKSEVVDVAANIAYLKRYLASNRSEYLEALARKSLEELTNSEAGKIAIQKEQLNSALDSLKYFTEDEASQQSKEEYRYSHKEPQYLEHIPEDNLLILCVESGPTDIREIGGTIYHTYSSNWSAPEFLVVNKDTFLSAKNQQPSIVDLDQLEFPRALHNLSRPIWRSRITWTGMRVFIREFSAPEAFQATKAHDRFFLFCTDITDQFAEREKYSILAIEYDDTFFEPKLRQERLVMTPKGLQYSPAPKKDEANHEVIKEYDLTKIPASEEE